MPPAMTTSARPDSIISAAVPIASSPEAHAVETVSRGPCRRQRRAICPAAMLGQAWMLSLRGTAWGPLVSSSRWASTREPAPAIVVPMTTPVLSGSRSAPWSCTACAAAARAYWAKRSVPDRTRSSIQRAGSKEATGEIQAWRPEGGSAQGAGSTTQRPVSRPSVKESNPEPRAEMTPTPVMATCSIDALPSCVTSVGLCRGWNLTEVDVRFNLS